MLRNAKLLARLLLAWWVLALGVAVAAPGMQAETAVPWICTGGAAGAQPAGSTDDGSAPPLQAGFDCPLCASAAAPPPRVGEPLAAASGQGVLPETASGMQGRPRASLPPARGPPPGAILLS